MPKAQERGKHLIKWRSLPYADATWEWRRDINNDVAVEAFKARNAPPASASSFWVASPASAVPPSPLWLLPSPEPDTATQKPEPRLLR